MNNRHFDLATAALDYAAAIKCENFDDAVADLARAAMQFAERTPPKDHDEDFSDCA